MFFNSYDGDAEFAIEDAMGQMCKKWIEKVSAGMNTIHINTNTLAEGVYNLKVKNPADRNGYIKQSRFVKGKKSE
jgi:hypothetical protein